MKLIKFKYRIWKTIKTVLSQGNRIDKLKRKDLTKYAHQIIQRGTMETDGGHLSNSLASFSIKSLTNARVLRYENFSKTDCSRDNVHATSRQRGIDCESCESYRIVQTWQQFLPAPR